MHISEYQLLTTRRYFSLLVAQFTNSLSDHILKVIIMLFALEQFTRDSMMAIAVAAFIIPFLICSHQAGILADTSEKSRHIRFIKFYELLISFLVAAAVIVNSFWLMVVSIALLGITVAYFLPYKHSILPQLVSSDELIAGNAFMNVMLFFSVLFAAFLYICLDKTGLAVAMCITSVLGVVASYFIPRADALTTDKVSYNLFEQDKIIVFCIICIAWFWMANFTYFALFSDYARFVLQKNYVALDLVAAYVLGMTISSLLINWLQKSEIKLAYLPLALLVLLVFSADLYFSSKILSMPLILIDLFCIGFAGGLYIVPLYATIQRRSAPIFRARNIACSSILNAKLIVVSFCLLMFFEHYKAAVTTSLLIVPVSALLLLLYIIFRSRV